MGVLKETKQELTVGYYARKKLEVIIINRPRLFPPFLTFTFIEESAVVGRLALPFSTFHLVAHIICDNVTQKRGKNIILKPKSELK